MCHLYNALLQVGILDAKWVALERVIDLFEAKLFPGGRPDTAETCYTAIHALSGISLISCDECKGERKRYPTEHT